MAVLASDLLQPAGHLDAKLFPGLDSSAVTAALDAYIAEAVTRISDLGIDDDDADTYTKAWAYCRAYTRISERLLAVPSSASIEGEAARQYDIKQSEGFARIASQWCARADALVPPDESPTAPERSSGTLRNRPVW